MASPSTTEITEVMFDTPALYYRYVRYVATSGHVNVGEVAFLLPDTDLEGPAAPSSSTAPGFYSGPVQVALSYGLADAQIFYTLDGSTPVGRETANCFKYTSPLILTNCCARYRLSGPINSSGKTTRTSFKQRRSAGI